MKRIIAAFAVCLCASSLPAQDARTAKRDLIRELLNVIDSKAMTQSSLDVVFARIEQPQNPEVLKDMSAEDRRAYDDQMKKYADAIRQYRERLYARIDYAKYADDVYAPIFDKRFSSDDLKQLIDFYKTPVGQKMARTMPEFAVGGLIRGSEMMQELGSQIRDEMQSEESAAHPWRRTMSDLRTVATATEAYATDENKYPNVTAYEQLRPILTPTYLKTLPEKDAWGTPYMYVASADGQHYRFVSAGADRHFDWNATAIAVLPADFQGKPMESPDADIIFQDGTFIQYPAASRQE